MKSSENIINSSSESKKQETWTEMRGKVEDYADATGLGIDEGIKESVTAFNVNGLPTSQSCEGHDFSYGSGFHMPWPWVRVEVPNEPTERFVGENALYEEVAKRENVSLDELKKGRPENLYVEVQKKIFENEETDEYKKWDEQNTVLLQKVKSLLVEFYKNRKVEPNVEIITDAGAGHFEVRSRDDRELKHISGELTDEEKADLMSLFPARQEEMKAFTEFLKQKFLKPEDSEKIK